MEVNVIENSTMIPLIGATKYILLRYENIDQHGGTRTHINQQMVEKGPTNSQRDIITETITMSLRL